MKISQIQVAGFGALRERTFDLNAPLTVVFGPNEAGKSTLMGFIRMLLFGFPTRSYMQERYEPVYGGVHGGAMTLVDDQGRRIRIERYEGKAMSAGRGGRMSSGTFRLILEDGSTGGEQMMKALLGGMTPELFRSLFAFGLSELQEIRSLQSDEVSEYLFSTGMGMEGGTVLRAERSLQHEMELLYKPRGTKQEINKILQTIEENEEAVRRSKELMGQFDQWTVQLSSIDQRILRLENALKEYRGQKEWYDKCRQAGDRWIRLQEIHKQVTALPLFESFPEEAAARFDAMIEERERALADKQSWRRKLEQLSAQKEAIEVDETLLSRKERLLSLLERANGYEDSKTAAAEFLAEMRSLDEQIDGKIRQIDTNWSRRMLESFSVDVTHKEQVRKFRDSLQHYKSEWERLEGERLRALQQEEMLGRTAAETEDELREMRRRTEQAGAGLGRIGTSELQSHFLRLRKEYDQWKQSLSELKYYKLRLDDQKKTLDIMKLAGEQRTSRDEAEDLRRFEAGQTKTIIKKRRIRKWLLLGVGLNVSVPAVYYYFSGDMMTSALGFFLVAVGNALLFLWLREQDRINPRSGPSRTGAYEAVQSLTDNGTAAIEHDNRLIAEQTALVHGLEQEIIELEGQAGRREAELHELLHVFAADREAAAAIVDIPREKVAGVVDFPSRVPAGNRVGFFSPASINDELMDGLQTAVEKTRQTRMEFRLAEEKLKEQRKLWSAAAKLREQLDEQTKEIGDSCLGVQQEWRMWLNGQRLDEQLSTDGVIEIFQHAEQALQLLQQRDRAKLKHDALLEQSRLFEEECCTLLERASVSDSVAELKHYRIIMEDHSRQMEEKLRLEQAIVEIEEQLYGSSAALARVEQRISVLWKEAQSDHEEQFRLHVRQHAERVKLLEEQLHVEVFLENWVGKEHQHELYEVLRSHDLSQLSHKMDENEHQAANTETQLHELRDQRGRLGNEMDKLKAGAEHAEKLQLLEEHISSFQYHSKRWATLALGAELFKKARELYERERQPEVLLRASSYFELITNGSFRRVMAPLNEKKLKVERSNGELLDTAYLSRGTAEQLYLSMRFALADEYARKVSLPLIMDDIFVNFDHSRLMNTLSVLEEVNKQHQIILFTCHSHVKEAIARIYPDAGCINL